MAAVKSLREVEPVRVKAVLDKLYELVGIMEDADSPAAAAAFRTAMHIVAPNSIFEYEPL